MLTELRLRGAFEPTSIYLILCVFLPHCSEWYLNGNYLVIIVSVAVILPLALMKQLGEYVISCASYSGLPISFVFQPGLTSKSCVVLRFAWLGFDYDYVTAATAATNDNYGIVSDSELLFGIKLKC